MDNVLSTNVSLCLCSRRWFFFIGRLAPEGSFSLYICAWYISLCFHMA